jgi:hypothetical protein
MRPHKEVLWMTGILILWASHFLRTVLPFNPRWHPVNQPKVTIQANVMTTNICVNRSDSLQETLGQAGRQWWILIWRSGLVKLYSATLCTLPLDLTYRSGFATAGRSIAIRRKCEWGKFIWCLSCINTETVLCKCCTAFTVHCKSFYFLHILHTAFHCTSLKQYTCRMTKCNKTSWQRVIFMGEEHQWSLWVINHISIHYSKLFNWRNFRKTLNWLQISTFPSSNCCIRTSMDSCTCFMSPRIFHTASKHTTPSHITYNFHIKKVKN